MNKKLQKQIKAYAGLAGVLIAADKANGQVVYVDINPDTLLDTDLNTFIVFDMNQDGQNDFYFDTWGFNSPTAGSNNGMFHNGSISINGYNNNQVLKGNTFGCVPFPNAFPLNQGDSIPSANQLNSFVHSAKFENWQNIFYSPGVPTYQVCYNAISPPVQDVYIGVKFDINGQFHYGWFKVELQGHAVLIKEYAYELQPNVPMVVCDSTNLPLASITPQGPLSFCSGGSVLLSANAGAGQSYQWKRNGIAISGATAQNYLATAAGRYRVVVTNCGASKTSAPVIVTVPCLPVKDPVEKTGMEISDRQFSFSQQNNSFHISFFEDLNALSISIYDLIGKEIFKKTFLGNEASFTIEKKGIYFVEVNSDKGVFRRKIFIY
jgi:type IX secretion system substrate protein